MKFLITNAMPLNGGDEALLRATIGGLRRRWPGCTVRVLCRALARCRRQTPDLPLEADLEEAVASLSAPWRALSALLARGCGRRIIGAVAWPLWRMVEARARRKILRYYQEADAVVSAPGGFLHDFYPIEERLLGLETAAGMGKPVLLCAQSIGPFWKEASKRRVRDVLPRLGAVCVREELSRAHLRECGLSEAEVRVTADAAFLWHTLEPALFRERPPEPPRRLGLCFRVWPLGDTAAGEEIAEKAAALCRELLRMPGRELLFLSTCQGVPAYVDDSEVALRVVARLAAAEQQRCTVERRRLGPVALIQALGACDAFLGMRLHACLLAMLGGTPAFGFGYEDKTEGIYRQLGLEEWQLPSTAPASAWCEGAARFLAAAPALQATLRPRLETAAARAEETFAALAKLLPPR